MSSSKKKTKKLGTSSSQRRTRTPNLSIPGFGSTIPAATILDLPRIQGVWREWHKAGIADRPWNLGAYVELLGLFVHLGLIDWRGMEDMKPKVLDILECVRSGVLTLEEFQARLDQS